MAYFRGLVARGLSGVVLVTSDDHVGLVAVIQPHSVRRRLAALRAGHHLGADHGPGDGGRDEFRRIHALHALWPLQETRQGIGAEGQQRELHSRREVLAVAREVRVAPASARPRSRS